MLLPNQITFKPARRARALQALRKARQRWRRGHRPGLFHLHHQAELFDHDEIAALAVVGLWPLTPAAKDYIRGAAR